MIVLLLWLATLIILVAIPSRWVWSALFHLEIWIISKFGRIEEL